MDNMHVTFSIMGFIFGVVALHKVIKLEKELKDNNILVDKNDPNKGNKKWKWYLKLTWLEN